MDQPTKESVEALTRDWAKTPRQVVQTVMGNYGPPDEATESLLIWHRNGRGSGAWRGRSRWGIGSRGHTRTSWNRPSTTAFRSTSTASWPVTGSVIPERTKGEVSAPCEGEELNFLALNLANDICTGAIDAEKARIRCSEIKSAFSNGEEHPYTQGLQFDVPQGGTADPDLEV